jgi:hypothetical protein
MRIDPAEKLDLPLPLPISITDYVDKCLFHGKLDFADYSRIKSRLVCPFANPLHHGI